MQITSGRIVSPEKHRAPYGYCHKRHGGGEQKHFDPLQPIASHVRLNCWTARK
jgi:hypothetical protein